MAAVDDTAGVEMKKEEGSYRSGHPPTWSVGGACNARLQIWQIWRKRSRSENKERKATTDLLVVFFLVLQVTAVLTADEERNKGGSHYGSPLLPEFRRGVWTHAPLVAVARGGDAPPLFHNHKGCPEFFNTVPEAFFVIFKCCCVYLDYWHFIYFELLIFCNM